MAYSRADMPIVEVVWLDSNSLDRWHNADDLIATVSDGMECRSAGYLLLDAADRIVIVQSQSETGSLAEAITIPRVAVLSLTRLEAQTNGT